MKHAAQRRAILDTARQLIARGLNEGTEGNIGLRVDDGLLVTPSGVPCDEMQAADIVAMTFSGQWTAPAGRKPSSEWRIHRDVLAARPDIHAVIHVHSLACTTLATLRRDIPAFHYMVAVAGGDTIRCARYETFGTEELSRAALVALKDRKACLLANHGMIACGAELKDALTLACEVERLAEMYLRALQIGEPCVLSKTEMRRVLKKFAAGYGYGSAPGEGKKSIGKR